MCPFFARVPLLLARLLCFSALAALLIAGPGARPAAAQLYSVTQPTGITFLFDDGQGILVDPGYSYGDEAQALSASGLVAFTGCLLPTLQYDRGLLWDGNTVVDQGLDSLGLIGEGAVFSINRSGMMAGYKSTIQDRGLAAGGYNPVADAPHAVLWDGTTSRDLNAILGSPFSVARSINDAGAVAGILIMPGSPAHFRAFLYDGTAVHDLGTLAGDSDSLGYGLNAAGQVVGRSGSFPSGYYYQMTDDKSRGHAVLYDNRGMRDLGTLPGLDQSLAYAINTSGQVVGWSWSWSPGWTTHAFLYDSTGMHDLGTLGGNHSQARAINSSGQIVGGSDAADGRFPSFHACLWANGTITDLNDLLLNGGPTLKVANGINDRGQILCETDFHKPVLLTPVAVPLARFSTGTLAFGNQAVGTASDVQTLTLTNAGQAPLHVGDVAITGANAAEFAITKDTGEAVLAPGATRSITVRFTPNDAGERDASLAITADSAPTPGTAQIALTGIGTVPGVELTPQSLSFKGQLVGTTSADQTIDLLNVGEAPLVIQRVAITGPDASAFTATDLAGVTLARGQSRTISVHFAPSTRGSQSATLLIDSNAPGIQGMTLTGDGVGPVLRLRPMALDFGPQPVGLNSSLALLIQNTGDAPLNLGSLTFQGPNAAEFTLATGGSGETLQPGDLTLLNIRFSPTITGSHSAGLVIPSDAAATPQLVPLAGFGTAPLLRLSSDSLIFSIQPAGSTAPQTVVFTNNGDAPLNIDSLTLAGPNYSSFHIISDSGEKSVAPGASRTVQLSFSPAAIASVHGPARVAGTAHIASVSYSATLEVHDNDPHPDSPRQIKLAALVAPPASVVAAPTGLTAVAVSSTQVNLSWTSHPSSEIAYEIYRKTAGGGYILINDVGPGQSSFSDRYAVPGTASTYRVRAVSLYLVSDYTNEASVTTSPSAPTELTASAVSSTQVNLSWTNHPGNEVAYEIYRKPAGGGFILINDVGPGANSFSDRYAPSGTAYTYRVRAVSEFLVSDYSNEASATPGGPAAAPGAPTGLTAAAVSSTQVNLKWTPHPGNQIAYEIYRKAAGESYLFINDVGPGASSFSDLYAVPGTAYTYRVRAVSLYLVSDYTNEMSLKTSP